MTQAQAEHRNPMKLLDEIKAIELEILEELNVLGNQLQEGAPQRLAGR